MVANESSIFSAHTTLQPTIDFQSLDAPEQTAIAQRRHSLEQGLFQVPELQPGENPDGTVVHYLVPDHSKLSAGATFNPIDMSVTFMIECDLRQVEQVDLVLFDAAGDPLPAKRVAMRKIGEWAEPYTNEPIGQFYVVLEGPLVKPGMFYGFQVSETEAATGAGLPARWAGDPYGKAIVPTKFENVKLDDVDDLLDLVNVTPQKSQVISIQEIDGLVTFPGVSGVPSIERVPLQQAAQGQRIFYEMHVQDTSTIPDELLEPELRGSQGTIKVLQSSIFIERLKALNVTHLELLPCQAIFSEWYLQAEGDENVWGYMPESFHALHGDYFCAREAHAQIRELIETINVLHENGIGLILDWVPGHTHEGDNGANGDFPVEGRGPSDLLRPFADALYYQTNENGSYRHDSGCGNTLGGNTQLSRSLLLSSRDWFLNTIGFDGLRVDQASLLGRGRDGVFYPHHGFLTEFTTRREGMEDKLLIAEPNDAGPEELPFFNGQFPYRAPGEMVGWDSEWSFRLRNLNNDVAAGHGQLHFENGEPLAMAQARVIAGSADIYAAAGAGVNRGITASAFHDGFTTYDAARVIIENRFNGVGEELRQGVLAGFLAQQSTNYMMRIAAERLVAGAEANGEKLGTDALQEEMAKRLALSMQANNVFKSGDILLSRGDEDFRSQDGNHNAYRNREFIGLNWAPNADREKVASMLQLRTELGVFTSSSCLNEGESILWYDRAGRVHRQQSELNRNDDAFIATLHRGHPSENGDQLSPVLVVRGEGQYLLPEVPFGWNWVRRFDSNRENPLEEKSLGKASSEDPTRKIATLYGPAGVAVYQLIHVSGSQIVPPLPEFNIASQLQESDEERQAA